MLHTLLAWHRMKKYNVEIQHLEKETAFLFCSTRHYKAYIKGATSDRIWKTYNISEQDVDGGGPGYDIMLSCRWLPRFQKNLQG
jgi:hypothetical protein